MSALAPTHSGAHAPRPAACGTHQQTAASEGNGAAVKTVESISADEIALYDRQIRLWGMKAQEHIRNANILLITIKGLANEVAKNLVLAGIGSLTLLDPEMVSEADLKDQFLLTADRSCADRSPVGLNRAEAASFALRKLNPLVWIKVETSHASTKHPSFFSAFDLVIATDLLPAQLQRVNTATRLFGRPFYAASSHGLYGFIFADLIEHDFVIERECSNLGTTKAGPESRTRRVLSAVPKRGDPKTEQVTKREIYSTWMLASDGARLADEIRKSPRRRRAVSPVLSCLCALWAFETEYGRAPLAQDHNELAIFGSLCHSKHKALGLPMETLRSEVFDSFMQNISTEIAPVKAVLGGQIAQDVINVLGANQQPIQNFVVFDGNTLEANVYAMHPDGDLGKKQLATNNEDALHAGTVVVMSNDELAKNSSHEVNGHGRSASHQLM